MKSEMEISATLRSLWLLIETQTLQISFSPLVVTFRTAFYGNNLNRRKIRFDVRRSGSTLLTLRAFLISHSAWVSSEPEPFNLQEEKLRELWKKFQRLR